VVTEDEALLELLAQLESRNYRFIAITPGTHERVLARPPPAALKLRDIFGWNRSFEANDIDPQMFALLRGSNCLEESGHKFRSRLRVASLCDRLFLHSSFPTRAADSVFFGPDTYRFISFVREEMRGLRPPQWIVDMGAGTGAGGIIAIERARSARLTLVDINPEAARLARINARFAGVVAEVSVDDCIPSGCDMIIANPPYMIDGAHRAYRDGGGLFGGEIALSWTRQALATLTRGGSLLLYTGAAVVEGTAPLLDVLATLAREARVGFTHRELDPDVFGEELARREYSQVDRIAALGIVLIKG
jgi:hypothetical protein